MPSATDAVHRAAIEDFIENEKATLRASAGKEGLDGAIARLALAVEFWRVSASIQQWALDETERNPDLKLLEAGQAIGNLVANILLPTIANCEYPEEYLALILGSVHTHVIMSLAGNSGVLLLQVDPDGKTHEKTLDGFVGESRKGLRS